MQENMGNGEDEWRTRRRVLTQVQLGSSVAVGPDVAAGFHDCLAHVELGEEI